MKRRSVVRCHMGRVIKRSNNIANISCHSSVTRYSWAVGIAAVVTGEERGIVGRHCASDNRRRRRRAEVEAAS